MIHREASSVEEQEIAEVPGVTVRWLIGEKEGAPNFHMRLFTLAPGASTPWHQHPWEHEIFVLKGNGSVRSESGIHTLGPGSAVFVAPNEWHQFRNESAQEPFQFLCLIPAQTGSCAPVVLKSSAEQKD
ncbi:MAG: cupin domain-containing protein [Armatimonadetes bacterium]|nr:cupin domain-containing protein [Armatimonadota bacterium]MDW8122968.1 cupin domain-containing protein [Armatimonadota bacterium]